MRRFFAIPIVILLLNFAVSAQNQSITADRTDDYIKILEAAYNKLKAAPYREVFQQVIELKNGFDVITETTTTEFVSPVRWRRIETTAYTYSKTIKLTDTIGFPRDRRKETVRIGDVEFVKQDAKPWEKTVRKELIEETKETKERDYVVNFLGRKNVNAVEFEIYEMVKIKDAAWSNRRIWINAKTGLLSKISFDLLQSEDATNRVELTYEPDASITIEAPKLN